MIKFLRKTFVNNPQEDFEICFIKQDLTTYDKFDELYIICGILSDVNVVII